MERELVQVGEESVRQEQEGERDARGVTKADEGRLLSSSSELSELSEK